MRSYSFFTIVLLCIAILIVDIFAFYWLQSITNLISSSGLVTTIHIIFWVFTIGLISSILICGLIVLLIMRFNISDPKLTSTRGDERF